MEDTIFASRLRKTREKRGLTQGQLSEKTGLQTSAISYFEGNTRKPSLANLLKLANALSVSADYLLGRVETENGSSEMANPVFRKYGELTDEKKKMVEYMIDAIGGKEGEK